MSATRGDSRSQSGFAAYTVVRSIELPFLVALLAIGCGLGMMSSTARAENATGVTGTPPQPVLGGGPDIIPLFTQNIGGGTSPVAVTFNPAPTYLPVPPEGRDYLYWFTWDFGDGAVVRVPGGPGSANAAMVPVTHTFMGDSIFTVTLTINITIVNNSLPASDPSRETAGPAAFVKGQVHVAPVNFPPTPVLMMLSSPATGALPYELEVDPSATFDEDGWVTWAAIDWGDGSAEMLTYRPPALPAKTVKHLYNAPGAYQATLSVIDNGRMPLGAAIPSLTDPRDPYGALNALIAANQSVMAAGWSSKFNPQLKQTFILVDVPANMTVTKGQFKIDMKRALNDKLDVFLRPNVFPESLANAAVVVTIGTGTTAWTLFPPKNGQPAQAFRTDKRGRFQDSAQGFLFDFNVKRQVLHIKLTKANLRVPFGLLNTTVVNGKVDVPITVDINNQNPKLGAKVRFNYNAEAGNKGIGKNAQSLLLVQ